ncbi:hypothetical protein F511_27732 [Dorcoceras hygrometricum]|uniref:Uncharacterized protein n=1 Tax=Dorcoceras hygrometricum TaxID=472368 RepID=A0A2Z7DGT0_9LAMI|nr:hypothetical protein F511_27732 [Dorcoceras hygrometricum]
MQLWQQCIEGSEPIVTLLASRRLAPTRFTRKLALHARTETPRQADRNKSDHGKRRRRTAALGVAGGGVAMIPCWRLGAWLQPDLQENWLFTVARTETPRQADRNKSDHGKRRRRTAALGVAGGGVAMRGRRRPFLRYLVQNDSFAPQQREIAI